MVADLDAEARGDVEIAVAVDLEAVGKALVVFVAGVQVEVALFVGERAVGLDDVTVNPVRAVVGDVEQRLVGRERDAVGELEAGVDDLFPAVGFDEPDFARFVGAAGGRIRDVEVAVVGDDEVVAGDFGGDDGRPAAGGGVGEDFARAGGDGVKAAVGSEGLAVGAFGVGDELSRFSVGADLIRFARGDVGEEDLALGVHGGALGETVTLADE